MKHSPELISLATLSLTQAISIFNQFLPPLTEVKRADKTNHSEATDVRVGEFASVALAVGIGAVMSTLTGNYQPLVVAVVASAGLVAIYEYALGV
jgi:hypothetical protein